MIISMKRAAIVLNRGYGAWTRSSPYCSLRTLMLGRYVFWNSYMCNLTICTMKTKTNPRFLMILLSQSPAVDDVTSWTIVIEVSMNLTCLRSLWNRTMILWGVTWLQSPTRWSEHISVDLAGQTSSMNTTGCNTETSSKSFSIIIIALSTSCTRSPTLLTRARSKL